MDEINNWNISGFMNQFSSREYSKKNLVQEYENIKNEIPEEIIFSLKEITSLIPKNVDSDKSLMSIDSKEKNMHMKIHIYGGDQWMDDFIKNKKEHNIKNYSTNFDDAKSSHRASQNSIKNPQKYINVDLDSKVDISSYISTVKDLAADSDINDISLISRDEFRLKVPIVSLDGGEQKGIIYGFRSWGPDHSVTISSQFSSIGNYVSLQPSTNLVEQRLIQNWTMFGDNSFSLFKYNDQDDGKQKNIFYKEEDEL